MKTKAIKAADDYLTLIQRFPLRPIRTQAELHAAHAIIDELSLIGEDDLTGGQLDYLLVLGDQVSRYEEAKESDVAINGLDLLKHLMEANDLTASDIGRVIGQRELGSKIVRGDRQISKANATSLGNHFGLPAELFLRLA